MDDKTMKNEIFERRRARALALMAAKEMGRIHSAPPLHRLLWKMNIHIPPPSFTPFWLNLVVSGSMYTLMMPLLLLLPSLPGMSDDNYSLIPNLIAGFFFGLTIAIFYETRKKVHNLPMWEQL
jgi:hypothetical protein